MDWTVVPERSTFACYALTDDADGGGTHGADGEGRGDGASSPGRPKAHLSGALLSSAARTRVSVRAAAEFDALTATQARVEDDESQPAQAMKALTPSGGRTRRRKGGPGVLRMPTALFDHCSIASPATPCSRAEAPEGEAHAGEGDPGGAGGSSAPPGSAPLTRASGRAPTPFEAPTATQSRVDDDNESAPAPAMNASTPSGGRKRRRNGGPGVLRMPTALFDHCSIASPTTPCSRAEAPEGEAHAGEADREEEEGYFRKNTVAARKGRK